MKLVTKNIHYAIKSLLYFAQSTDKVITVGELVKKLNMRRPFLRRILQILSKHKILRSQKGYRGGFVLNMKPDKIRIIDILNIFHGDSDIIDCLLEKDICPYPARCLLMRKIKSIGLQLNKALAQLTIKKLLASIGRQIRKN